jgi:HTH-type transcriptional regulator / antitoxin HipB
MTKINDAKSLGRSIRAVRKALGLTQDQLALTSGTNRRFIVELESGKATAQIGKALIVLQSLGMSLEVTPPASVELTDRTIENGEPEDGPAT